MRVYERDAVAFAHVPYRHVLEQRGLASTRLADDVHVLAAICRLYAELHAARVRGGFPDRDDVQF